MSVAFAAGEPSLRSGKGNEWLLRLERIDKVLTTYADDKGETLSVDAINGWIDVQGNQSRRRAPA